MKICLHKKTTTTVFIILGLSSLILSSCGSFSAAGYSTWTPLPSATPTCIPTALSTPVGWSTTSQLIIFLFNPNPNLSDPNLVNEGLELSDGQWTQDIPAFVNRIVPKLIKPSDQVSIFSLGYTTYEAARITRQSSTVTQPQLYDAPPPLETLTPIPTVDGTIVPGLVGIATRNAVKAESTAHASTATAMMIDHTCKVNYWNTSAKLTATAWAKAEAAEIANLSNKIKQEFDTFEKTKIFSHPPFRSEELYHGLANATIDIANNKTGCGKY